MKCVRVLVDNEPDHMLIVMWLKSGLTCLGIIVITSRSIIIVEMSGIILHVTSGEIG